MALRAKINPEKIPDRVQPLSIYKLNVTRGGEKILEDISFEVGYGEILGIAGKPGAGKTTLFSALAGTLDVPEKNIEFVHALHDGADLFALDPQERYKQGIHCVAVGRNLFGDMSIKDNLAVAMPFAANKVESRINDIVELFPAMNDLLDKKARNCSAGQQQIVSIARSIMVFPSVLILDEPTSGLSPHEVDAVREMLSILISGSVGIVVFDQRTSFLNDVATRQLTLSLGKLSEPIVESIRAAEWKPT